MYQVETYSRRGKKTVKLVEDKKEGFIYNEETKARTIIVRKIKENVED